MELNDTALALAHARIENGRLLIRRENLPGFPDVEEREIEVVPFLTAPARVTVSYEVKLQVQPYEMASAFVSVTMPCYRELIDETRTWLEKYVGDKIEAEKQSIEKAREAIATRRLATAADYPI